MKLPVEWMILYAAYREIPLTSLRRTSLHRAATQRLSTALDGLVCSPLQRLWGWGVKACGV